MTGAGTAATADAEAPADAEGELRTVMVVPSGDSQPAKVAQGGVVVAFDDLLDATVAREGMDNDVAWRAEWADRYREAAGAWLLWAAARGDAEEVVDLLAHVSGLAHDIRRRGVLHLAALRGDLDMVNVFCERASDDLVVQALSTKDSEGFTPLLLALQKKQWPMVLALAKLGGTPTAHDRVDTLGRTLLHWAMVDNNLDAAKILVSELGADIEARDSSGRTPLLLALRRKRWKAADAMVDMGSKLMGKRKKGSTALMIAAKRAPASLLRKLVASGNALEAKDIDGRTALFYSVVYANEEGLATLLELGADPSVVDFHGFTALDIALRRQRRGSTAIVDTLLSMEDVDCSQDSLDFALGSAVKRGLWPLVHKLIARGVDVTSKIHGERGMTPLMFAARSGELQTAVELLAHGADVTTKSRRGSRASDEALGSGHRELAKFLWQVEERVFTERRARQLKKDVQKNAAVWARVSQYGWGSY